MESVLHPSSLHFFTEIYPNKTLNLFFGSQVPPDSKTINKDIDMMTRMEDKKLQRRQQRRQTLPAPSLSQENDSYIDNEDKELLSKRYQRWSWTASSTVLPMETIQEEDE